MAHSSSALRSPGLVLAVLCLVGALSTAPVAEAQGLSQTVYAPGDGSPNSITLPIYVTASVGGRCGFSSTGVPQGVYDAGEIDTTSWQNQFAFVLECTGPSRVAVVSSNGGLLNSGASPLQGYTNLAPYAVALHLVGSTSTADDSCMVTTLASGSGSPCGFIGPATQTQGLYLSSPSYDLTGSYLQVSAPAFAGPSLLFNGNYTDTLTVTLSASI